MKLAFSTLTCPRWDPRTLAARCREFGYDGVELAAADGRNGADAPDPEAVREALQSVDVEIACVSCPTPGTGTVRGGGIAFEEVGLLIERAADLGCRRVAITNAPLRRGQSAAAAAVALGNGLLPLADDALTKGVTLLIENAHGLRRAGEIWALLDRLAHPALACCWDPLNAALVGEGPSLSVPTLNSRIRYARVKDARLAEVGAAGPSYCRLGDGDVEIKKFIARLRGVGYAGYLVAAWEEGALSGLGPPERLLPEAAATLRSWAKGTTGTTALPASKSNTTALTKPAASSQPVAAVP